MLRKHLGEGAWLLALTAVILWLYRLLVVGRVLAAGDLESYFFPYWMAATRIAHHTDPLQHLFWEPWLFAGAPLAANSQAGIFYPLNWPFWRMGEASLTSAAHTLHCALLLHLLLAGWNAYGLSRSQRLPPSAAFIAGLLYGGGGFLSLHSEHLNQLQGLAWLPLLFLEENKSTDGGRGLPWLPGIALGMMLLAGHLQTAFIAVVGALLHRVGAFYLTSHRSQPAKAFAGSLLKLLLPALTMAAPQLFLTLRLSRHSIRSQGLPWREALSFSLPPWELHRALLPPYLVPPLLPEGVAYFGIGGLVLAGWGLWQARSRRDRETGLWGGLALAGLLLAMGGYNPFYLAAARLRLPGVIQFRAPARYLALYTVGVAQLAAQGWHSLQGRKWRWLALLLPLELTLAQQAMPIARATDIRAYSDLRPATARLIAAREAAEQHGEPPPRFLSLSQTLFEPGDKGEIISIYGEQLSDEALWSYLVAAKDREVLAPNLPLAFRVPAVDGYDGGLLPTRDYALFSRLLLPEGTLDGRLRENLQRIPDQRWLDLLGVGYLMTDKTGDRWIDGVFYDCQSQPHLTADAMMPLATVPPLESTALSILYTGTGALDVALEDGRELHFTLPLRTEAEPPLRLQWGNASKVRSICLIGGPQGLDAEGATLLDERTGAFQALTLSSRFHLIHSGDVKIYADDPPPRAFFVAEGCTVEDGEAALRVMQTSDFDPYRQVVLYAEEATAIPPCTASHEASLPDPARVTIITYTAQEVVVAGESAKAGYLILTDAWYPAWYANGEPTLHADILFRAVPVPAGRWEVIFTYEPWR